MTEATVSADYALIRQYLVKVSAGLKQIGELQKKEILAETDSHLRERIEELRAGGEPHPVEPASLTMSAVSSTFAHTTACTRRRAPFRSR